MATAYSDVVAETQYRNVPRSAGSETKVVSFRHSEMAFQDNCVAQPERVDSVSFAMVSKERPMIAPLSRGAFHAAVAFGLFSAIVSGFALVSEQRIASTFAAFSLCLCFAFALVWLEMRKRERK